MDLHAYRCNDSVSIKSEDTTMLAVDSYISQNYTTLNLWQLISKKAYLAILLSLLSLTTVTGNILIIVAVVKESYLQTATNFFITSLAFADCLVGLVVMPFSAMYEILEKRWIFTIEWCDTWRSLDVLFSTASILNLCVISIDRYWAIKDPFSYPLKMTYKLAFTLITLVWLASSLISFPAIMWWRVARANIIPQHKCPFTMNFEYIIFSSMISFYLPLIVMVFTYYKIYREAVVQSKSLRIGAKQVILASGTLELTLRMHRGGRLSSNYMSSNDYLLYRVRRSISQGSDKHLNSFRGMGNTKSSICTKSKEKPQIIALNKSFSLSKKISKFSKEKKAAKALGIVMGVFIICWFPFFAVNLWSGLCDECIWKEESTSTAVSWLGWINSSMNPVIYACWSKDFKR
ncbi:dopamine receptor 2-like isoform X1 [Copidosoma floridanum]|uniref:dopamine receptor 2-like isoform X1 n=1 Tax=Copidosoma floridanum TaxID=29053 RepID=UPI0006C958E2|nr:dopamine receptor 2-like isoform X1 [Copidosoma floridanum]